LRLVIGSGLAAKVKKRKKQIFQGRALDSLSLKRVLREREIVSKAQTQKHARHSETPRRKA
jgi:hypothetical protein